MKAASRRSGETIAIFGGSFDPPHIAHVELLKKLQAQLQFEKIWIVPSKYPPGKTPVADYATRARWCDLVFRKIPGVQVSYLEENSSQTIFGKDIFYQIQIEEPEAAHCWILGEDQWERLPYWKDIDEYANRLGWVVFPRKEFSSPKTGYFSRRLRTISCYYSWAMVPSLPDASSTRLREVCSMVSFQKSEFPQQWSWLAEEIREEVCDYYFKQNKKDKA